METDQPIPPAFVLGAGLGTRLRPLTNRWPKPLVPLAHRPLIHWAFRHLARDLRVPRFIVNTHHLPEAYDRAFPDSRWEDRPIRFQHEPTLLDTGGGVANIRDLLAPDEDLILYNGDIFTTIPLAPLMHHHMRSRPEATLLLRKGGPLCNVACHAGPGHPAPVLDIRGLRGVEAPLLQFTGIALLSPELLRTLPEAGTIFSLIPFLVERLAKGGRIDGVCADDAVWLDLGTWPELLRAHRIIAEKRGIPAAAGLCAAPRIHPGACVPPGALDDLSWAGPGVVVARSARVRRSVLLEGARIARDAQLDGCLVAPGQIVEGSHHDALLVGPA